MNLTTNHNLMWR